MTRASGSGADARSFRYSVVIPVYNSEGIVAETVARTVEFFRGEELDCEIILVNDGSPDGSWPIIADLAEEYPEVVSINLLRNVGQHSANLCGFRESTGDYVITMDDDMQNPPSEIIHLIGKAMEGYDVVFGRFDRKKASGFRSLGTSAIARVNRKIFGQPRDLEVTNFRILRRDVVDRIVGSRTAYPYITGQSLLYSRNRANVDVRHDARPVGKSNYSLRRIAVLVFRILFSYSAVPLRAVAAAGAGLAVLSMLVGLGALVRAVFWGSSVPGWPSLVIMIAFLNGVMIAMLSMLGEYVVRILNQLSEEHAYTVVDRVGGEF